MARRAAPDNSLFLPPGRVDFRHAVFAHGEEFVSV
jgi:hypothetical protein